MDEKRVNVLLIEDDPDDATFMERYFRAGEENRFKLEWCEDPQLLGTKYREQAFDVILIDFYLGSLNAFEVIDLMPLSLRESPIIILSKYGDRDIDRRAMDLGVEFFFDKADLRRGLLERTIRYAMRNKDLQNRLNNFASIVAHDVTGPLRNISKVIEVLTEMLAGKLDRSEQALLHEASDECSRLVSLVADLLQYSRSSSGTVSKRLADLNDMLESTKRSIREEIERRAAVVRIEQLPLALVDEELMSHVFLNLLQNALKYTEGRVPEISIEGEQTAESVLIRVRDNGIGIEREYWERIFNPLQRLHAVSRFEGTGLGLSICREIVERHGGKIWVESEVGVGSVFTVELPRASEEEVAAAKADVMSAS